MPSTKGDRIRRFGAEPRASVPTQAVRLRRTLTVPVEVQVDVDVSRDARGRWVASSRALGFEIETKATKRDFAVERLESLIRRTLAAMLSEATLGGEASQEPSRFKRSAPTAPREKRQAG